MDAKSETVQDRSHAVLIQGILLARPGGKTVIGILVGVDRTAFEEGNNLVQHACIRSAPDIAADRQGQPEIVVGAVCANAPAGGGMPPMLHVSIQELTACAE